VAPSAQVVAGSVMVHSVVVPLVTVTVPVGVMPEGRGDRGGEDLVSRCRSDGGLGEAQRGGVPLG